MISQSTYWIGEHPSNGKPWGYTTSGTVLSSENEREAIYRMYRRFVKQWNDVELNIDKCLSEHTHEICGAKICSHQSNGISLHYKNDDQTLWILDVFFSGNFNIYYPGASCGRNTLRSHKDIRSICLHWNHNGKEEFLRWLEIEKITNKDNEEWNVYKD